MQRNDRGKSFGIITGGLSSSSACSIFTRRDETGKVIGSTKVVTSGGKVMVTEMDVNGKVLHAKETAGSSYTASKTFDGSQDKVALASNNLNRPN